MHAQNPVFIPGPTNIPEVLRKAVDMPTLDHRSPAFGEILRPALEGVRRVVKSGQAEVFVFPGSGTGGWETAISNTLSPGDRVLAARHGLFSQRWIDMCRTAACLSRAGLDSGPAVHRDGFGADRALGRRARRRHGSARWPRRAAG